jgi:hypothetical protein
MRIKVTTAAAVTLASAISCSSAPFPEQNRRHEVAVENGAAGGAGAPNAEPADDTAFSSNELAPVAGPTFATLRRDYTNPAWINPILNGNQWVCALGRVQGNFQLDEGWPDASVTVHPTRNEWILTGYDGQAIVGANCVTLNRFSGTIPAGQSATTRWVSGELWHNNEAGSCNAFLGRRDAWWGDAATFLTGMSGGFYGAGESVNITQNDDPRASSYLWTTLCQGSNEVVGRSIFVGDPSAARQAKFKGPWGVGSAAATGEYSVDRNAVNMARLDEAFCYFTSIRGAFAGGGEKAEIKIVTDSSGTQLWSMSTVSQQGELTAKARCYMYDQT